MRAKRTNFAHSISVPMRAATTAKGGKAMLIAVSTAPVTRP